MRKSKKTKSKKAKKIFFYLACLILIYLISEIIVMSTGVFIDSFSKKIITEFYMPDSELGLKIRPNLKNFDLSFLTNETKVKYSTDHLGFRNIGRDYDSSKYFFVGDSFTYGARIKRNETFCGLIEKEMHEPMINLGVPNYGITQYKIVINKYIPKNDLNKTVFLGIFANDLTKPLSKEFLSNFYKKTGWNEYLKNISFSDRFSKSRSLTYNILLILKSKLFNMFSKPEKVASNGLIINIANLGGTRKHYIENKHYIDVENEIKNLLKDIESRKDIKLIVLLFPSKGSTYKQEYIKLFDDNGLSDEEQGYARLQNLFKNYSIPVYDLTDYFRSNNNQILYFKKDQHWNEAGHELAFNFIKEQVLEK